MANVLKMDKQVLIQELIGLGWSYRRIERETGIRRETIAHYDGRRAEPAKVPTEEDVAADHNRPKCPPTRLPTRTSSAAAHDAVIRDGLRCDLSAQRIYQDLVTEHAFDGSYDAVKRYVRKLKKAEPEVYARLHAAPGEEAQVDFGEGAPTLKNGRYVKPWLFKIVLSCSRHSFEEVVWRQDVETFIRCHERAFAFFGGVPRLVRLDNLKSGVLKAHLYEPELNPVYAAFATHAGFTPLPCLPNRPEHKGKTESGVGYTQRNALKGLRFESIEEQNAHLRRWNETWARTRIHGTTKQQVWTLFTEGDGSGLSEREALQPLPEAAFPLFKVAERKVHPDGHVEVQRAYYSVPHQFVGQTLSVHFNERHVKILHRGEVVAFHHRISAGRFRSDHAHVPDHKDPSTFQERILNACARIGEGCAGWARAALAERGPLALRAIQGVVSLRKKHGPENVEAACAAALEAGSTRYHTVQLFLTTAPATTPQLLTNHELMRPLAEYQLHLDNLTHGSTTVPA